MRVLVTRPLADALPLAETLRSLGHLVSIDPVIEIVANDTPAPSVTPETRLIFTSANGARAWAVKSDDRAQKVHTVGHHTRQAAQHAGFMDVASAGGNVDALVRQLIDGDLPPDTVFLHVRGEAVAGDPVERLAAAGFRVSTYIAYEAIQLPSLSATTIASIAAGEIDAVLFFSPRTARHFTSLLKMAGLAATTGGMAAFCLSDAVADSANAAGFGRVAVARRPTQTALLELLS